MFISFLFNFFSPQHILIPTYFHEHEQSHVDNYYFYELEKLVLYNMT